MTPTYVLVHGTGSNATAWAPVLRELALRGHRALAVDLPGHGANAHIPRTALTGGDPAGPGGDPSTMASISTADDVAAVSATLRRAREHGPVVLVGHSRGGLTLTAVANTAPDLVDHLVYVSAWCCVEATVAEYMAGPEHAAGRFDELGPHVVVANPMELGALRFDWRTGDPVALDLLQDVLLGDGTRDELVAWLHAMDPDETLHVDDDLVRVHPEVWGRLPHTYVRLSEDRSLPIGLQDRFVAEADAAVPGNPFRVATIATSHLGVQVRPDALVDVLEGCRP